MVAGNPEATVDSIRVATVWFLFAGSSLFEMLLGGGCSGPGARTDHAFVPYGLPKGRLDAAVGVQMRRDKRKVEDPRGRSGTCERGSRRRRG